MENPDQALQTGGPSLIHPGSTNPGGHGQNPDAAGANPAN